MGMDGGPAAPQKVNIKDRKIMAMDLRKKGYSYRRIAEEIRRLAIEDPELGLSPKYNEAAAYFDVMSELKKLNAKVAEAADETRRLELERLDAMWTAHYEAAVNGDVSHLHAAIKIMAQRAALLGLNAPVAPIAQVNVNVGVTSDELAEARSKALALESEMLGSDEQEEGEDEGIADES